ncbi:universal stress protein [Kyrpidia sp.]|uniref:universal stress protein n=1 Tax=Kyrpidia sp. TaxID=2073077 RepID=UPI0025901C6D|nr:universal stress protein [Kyrpidia sp.]MCL6576237.1 universal stress protein [Kyrpidia sp.]
MKWFDALNPLSSIFDLMSGARVGRSRRVAYLAAKIGLGAGLGLREARTLYFAGLLHDVGALVGPSGDFKRRDPTFVPVASAQWVRSLDLDPWTEVFVGQSWENWDGSGVPFGLRGREISLGARIVRVAREAAQVMDRAPMDVPLAERLARVRAIGQRAGEVFDPDVVRVFEELLGHPEVVLDAFGPYSPFVLLSKRPAGDAPMSSEDAVKLARMFGRLAGVLRGTPNHAERVAGWAMSLGEEMGLSERDLYSLNIAAYYHDVGWLVGNPGGTFGGDVQEERERLHSYYTQAFLQQIPGLEGPAIWTGQHHERIDGTGYPGGLAGEMLSLPSRILQVAEFLVDQEMALQGKEGAGVKRRLARLLHAEELAGRLDGPVCRAAMKRVSHDPEPASRDQEHFYHLSSEVSEMKKVLFATDGSEASKKAEQMVADILSKWTEAEVTVLYVSQTVPYYYEATPDLLANLSQYEESWAKQIEETVMNTFKDYKDRVRFKHLVGHPATAICDVADEENVDLIVVGTHGRGAIDRVLLGSVSHGVLNRAKHSVLVVR